MWVTEEDTFAPLESHIQEAYFIAHKGDKLQLGEAELEILVHYLRRMLVLDPQQRPTAKDLMSGEWISEATES